MAEKLFTYISILIGIEFLLIFSGIPTNVGTILHTIGVLGDTTSLSGFNVNAYPNLLDTIFFGYFTTALALVAAAGIIASFFFRDSGTTALTAVIATALLSFSSDFANLIYFMFREYPNSPLSYVVAAILTGFWIGMIISVIEWWGGND